MPSDSARGWKASRRLWSSARRTSRGTKSGGQTLRLKDCVLEGRRGAGQGGWRGETEQRTSAALGGIKGMKRWEKRGQRARQPKGIKTAKRPAGTPGWQRRAATRQPGYNSLVCAFSDGPALVWEPRSCGGARDGPGQANPAKAKWKFGGNPRSLPRLQWRARRVPGDAPIRLALSLCYCGINMAPDCLLARPRVPSEAGGLRQ